MNLHIRLRFLIHILLFALVTSSLGNLQAQSGIPGEFKPSGKIWGYAFGDLYTKAAGDTATWASRAEYSGTPKDVYAFAFRRFYLGYDYQISPVFSTYALLEGNENVLSTKGDRGVTIKSLYVKWSSIFKNTDLVLGQIPTLAFAVMQEKVWGYRSLEKTIIDQRGIRSSSDMGVAIYGRFDSLATYGYNIMVGNGAGTKPEDLSLSGRSKIYSAEVYGNLFKRKLFVNLYGDIQVDHQPSAPHKNVFLVKGFVAYQSEPLTVGVEVFSQRQLNAKSDGTDVTPFGFSAFVKGRLIKNKLQAFARYDSYNPDNSYRDSDVLSGYNAANMFRHYDEQFFLAGLDYTPHKNVHLMPNLWVNSYAPKADAPLLVDRKADIIPRLTFFFIFR